jgi:hypothetical protein
LLNKSISKRVAGDLDSISAVLAANSVTQLVKIPVRTHVGET